MSSCAARLPAANHAELLLCRLVVTVVVPARPPPSVPTILTRSRAAPSRSPTAGRPNATLLQLIAARSAHLPTAARLHREPRRILFLPLTSSPQPRSTPLAYRHRAPAQFSVSSIP